MSKFSNLKRKVGSQKELLELHQHLTQVAHKIIHKKNSDYNGIDDPFRNFGRHGAAGVLVRLSDKIDRLENFVTRGGSNMQVIDEKWEDTVVDAINYLILLDGYVRTHGTRRRWRS